MAKLCIATDITGYQSECRILYHPESMVLQSLNRITMEYPVNKVYSVERRADGVYERQNAKGTMVFDHVFAQGQVRYLLPAVFKEGKRDYLVCDGVSNRLFLYRLFQTGGKRYQARFPEKAFTEYENGRLVLYDSQVNHVRAYIAV